jgi:hypothetical protein
MKVQYVDGAGKTVETVGLFGMDPKDRIGRQKVFHSNIIPVNNSGRCTSLEGGKRALFVVLEGSEVHVGFLNAEFLLGIRLDEPGEMRTTLVCKCGLREFGKPEMRYPGVSDFFRRVCEQGHLPQHDEVPMALLNTLKYQRL